MIKNLPKGEQGSLCPKAKKNALQNAQQTAQTTKNEKIPLELRFKNLSLYDETFPKAPIYPYPPNQLHL